MIAKVAKCNNSFKSRICFLFFISHVKSYHPAFCKYHKNNVLLRKLLIKNFSTTNFVHPLIFKTIKCKEMENNFHKQLFIFSECAFWIFMLLKLTKKIYLQKLWSFDKSYRVGWKEVGNKNWLEKFRPSKYINVTFHGMFTFLFQESHFDLFPNIT